MLGCSSGGARPVDLGIPADAAISSGCSDPLDSQPDGGVCVRSVAGKVVDENGAPLPGLLVSVCAGACYFGRTLGDGAFTVPVSSHIQIDFFALLVHGGPDRASYYVSLPPLVGDTMTYSSPLFLPRLPSSGPVIATDGSAQTLTAGEVTIALAAGTTVTLGVEDVVAGPIGSQLRPVKMVDPKQLPFVDPAAPPDVLYAFSLFEVQLSRKTPLVFANGSGLPAGAAVDVQAMGGLIGARPPAGNFTSVAEAHVSADGKTITMDPGEGVLGLTWIALRKR